MSTTEENNFLNRVFEGTLDYNGVKGPWVANEQSLYEILNTEQVETDQFIYSSTDGFIIFSLDLLMMGFNVPIRPIIASIELTPEGDIETLLKDLFFIMGKINSIYLKRFQLRNL